MNSQTESGKKKKDEYVRLPYFGINRLLPFMRPYRKKLFMMLILGIVGSLVDIVLPLFQSYAINNYIALGIMDTLPYFIGLYILVLTVQIVANCFTTYNASYVEMMIGHDLKQTCFDHLQTLSFSYFNQNSVGMFMQES